jgi:Uma2 family endonuclease
MTIQTPTILTAAEFADLEETGLAELIRGRVVPLTKPKPKHGRIAMQFGAAISAFVGRYKLGEVYAAETGFIVEHNPDSVRAPDVAFVRTELVLGHDEEEWYPHSPDLAVEVLSPTDRVPAIQEKVRMWLDGGARSVWVVDPATVSVAIHHPDGSIRVVKADEELRDDAVLPGFSLSLLSTLFGPTS